jgi:protocatechuate 3,4-dioxygenase beta subunit
LTSLLVIAGLVQPPVSAQRGTTTAAARVTATVVDSNGLPVRRARVLVSGPTSERTDTDLAGQFSIGGVPDGVYQVQVTKPGFVHDTPSAVTLRGDRPVEITIRVHRAGAIAGRVVDQSGRPFPNVPLALLDARAGIRPESEALSRARSDDEGRFRFATLRAGTYAVWVPNPTTFYPGTPDPASAQPIALDWGQTVDVELPVPATAPSRTPPIVVAGRVVDEFGDGAPDVTVGLLRAGVVAGKTRWVALSGGVSTDDSGRFRVANVQPGDYCVVALSGPFATGNIVAGPTGPQAEGAGFAATFFPGTAVPSDAAVLQLREGRSPPPLDFALVPADFGQVTGRVVDAAGQPASGARVMLMELHGGDLRIMIPARATATGSATFEFRNVPVGTYVVQVFSASGFASQRVSVSPGVASAPLLTLGAHATVRGRFVFDGSAGPPPPNEILMVSLPTDYVTGPVGRIAPKDSIAADYSFEVAGMYGLNRFRFAVPKPWTLQRIIRDGRDITDTDFDASMGDLTDVEVRFTDRPPNVVAGTVVDVSGQPVPSAFVLLFAQDRSRWGFPSRFVRGVTTGSDGRFTATGLPSTSYWAVTFRSMPRPDWMNPEFLQALQGRGETLFVNEIGTTTVHLRIVGGPAQRLGTLE